MLRPLVLFAATLVGVTFVALSSGCRTADLRPENMTARVDEVAIADGLRCLAEMRTTLGEDQYERCGAVQVQLTDDWSSLLRVFTPLEDDRVELRLDFQPRLDCVQLEVRDGDGAGRVFGLDPNGAFEIEGSYRAEEGKLVRSYLHSLALYLSLPLQRFPFAAELGDETVDGVSYRRVYASPGGADLDEKTDQYVFWIPKDGGLPRFVEFTYRKIGASYVGTLAYDDWAASGGVTFPQTVAVVDEPGDGEDDAVHTLTVSSVRIVARAAAFEEGIFDPAVFTID